MQHLEDFHTTAKMRCCLLLLQPTSTFRSNIKSLISFEFSAKAREISNFEISKYNNMTHSSGLTLQGMKEILFLGE